MQINAQWLVLIGACALASTTVSAQALKSVHSTRVDAKLLVELEHAIDQGDTRHARLVEPPGFHYGADGKPSPLERVRQGYSIGHSELNGAQHWCSALEYGRKAGERAAASA